MGLDLVCGGILQGVAGAVAVGELIEGHVLVGMDRIHLNGHFPNLELSQVFRTAPGVFYRHLGRGPVGLPYLP